MDDMRFAFMTEPQQGYSYQDLLEAALAAEAAGFEAFFRSDHYASFPGESGLPTTDAWATLAGLARETTTIRLGTMVSPVTFRIPGSLAKVVATVDEMSGGRVEMGVGAGWNEIEHAQLGIPYPDTVERVDRLEEELAILRGLWDEPDGWSFEGEHYQVRESLFRPRGERPHLIVGGTGKPRSLRLAATYADEYDISSAAAEDVPAILERLDAACDKVGRDPRTLERSVMAGVLVGRDEAEFDRLVVAQAAVFGDDETAARAWLEPRLERWVAGPPEQAAERIEAYRRTGIDRLALQCLLPRDTDHIAAIGELIAAA